MKSKSDIIGYIKRYEGVFSKAEAKIADFVIKNTEKIADYSVEDIASATGTSGATVVRFCRTIGFKGFLDFKYQIEHNVLYVMETEQQIDRSDDITTIAKKVIKYQENLLKEFSRALDTDLLETACSALKAAQRVIIYAEGGSASMGEYARTSFIHTGIYCTLEVDASMQIMSSEYITPNDVVIGITHSGRILNTIQALRNAKKRGATVIAITGSTGTPVCRYADVVLACNNKHFVDLSDFQGSRLEEFCIISILQIGTLVKSYNSYAEISKRVAVAAESKRVGRRKRSKSDVPSN